MLQDGWQYDTLDRIRFILDADEDVIAAVLFGSLVARPDQVDWWSDIDLLVVVRDGTRIRFLPASTWLERVGDLFTYEHSVYEHWGVIRAVFQDLRRIDAAIVEEGAIERMTHAERHPLRGGHRTLFSRSSTVDVALAAVQRGSEPTRTLSADAFATMCREFWFVAHLALKKAVRGDLLIAAHLTLGLLRECMVLQMHERDDRFATGYHRDGADGAATVQRLAPGPNPFTFEGIVNTIERTAREFDRLARARAADSYDLGIDRILEFVGRARNTGNRTFASARAFPRITVNRDQMAGAPCIRGLRIPVVTVVGMVAEGMTRDEILADYPDLESEDIDAALHYAAETVSERTLPLADS